MKKLIAIPLLILYLVAVSGTMVQFHFCGDKLSSFNINIQDASCCCGESKAPLKSGMSFKEDNCCSDKTITLKIVQDQNTTHNAFLQLTVLQLALPPVYTVPVVREMPETRILTAYRANAPPGLWQNIPLYRLHSRLTYYG